MAKKRSPHNIRSKGYHQRKTNVREPRKTILIVCQGEKTEPFYFKRFGTEWLHVKCEPVSKDPSTLVNEAIRMKKQKSFDVIWCVFDKDDTDDQIFDNAIRSAKRENIKVAYSNECFELWYILHFEYLKSGIPRKDYVLKLENNMGCKYSKKDRYMYDRLIDHMDFAINNAKRLINEYEPFRPPSKNNPSTTVYLLVEELKKQSKPRY